MKSFLDVSKVLWVPRGLTADYAGFGTNGHIDIVCCFARPGVLLVHVQQDPAHPDFEVSKEYLGILRNSTDAKGRPLEIVEVLPLTDAEKEAADIIASARSQAKEYADEAKKKLGETLARRTKQKCSWNR